MSVTGEAQFRGRFGGSSATRMLSTLAVIGGLLGGLGRPAAADASLGLGSVFSSGGKAAQAATATNPNIPLRMDLWKLQCLDEQDDGTFDLHSEPYLVVFAADTSLWYSRAFAVRSQIFGDVDTGETHYPTSGMQIWDFNNNATPITDPNKLIFLAALLECDGPSSGYQGANADAVQRKVQSELIGKLYTYRSAGLSRDAIVNNLKNDMNVAINAARGSDDRIGTVQELRLSLAEVEQARLGYQTQVTKTVIHKESGAEYRAIFVLQPASVIIY